MKPEVNSGWGGGSGAFIVSAEPTSPVWASSPVLIPGSVSDKALDSGRPGEGLKVERIPDKLLT